MFNKKLPTLFFFLLIALSLLTVLPSTVEPVYATDYDIFEITNTRDSLYMTYVYNNYLYVYNASYILQYDLATKTQNNTINLNGNTIVYSMIGRGEFLYLNATETGDPTVIAVDLVNCIEADRMLHSQLTDWNGDIKNIAYVEYSGIDYWAWINVTGTQVFYYYDSFITMNAYSTPYPQQPRFTALAEVSHGTNVADITIFCFVWNGTGVEYDETGVYTVGQHRGATLGVSWNTTPSVSVIDTHQNDGGSYRQHGYNIYAFTDAEARYEPADPITRSTYSGVYMSGDLLSVHSFKSTNFQESPTHDTGSDNYDYFVDTEDHIIRIDRNVLDEITVTTHRAGVVWSYGSTMAGDFVVDVFHTGDWARTNPIGVVSAIETLNQWGDLSLFVAYVQANNQTPVAIRVVGGGAEYHVDVGELPAPYDPDDCVLWANKVGDYGDYEDDSIVAVWTENADTSLYVCVNLIEGQYMRYGEDVSVQAQVYKSYATGTAHNFRLETRWMIDATNYPRIANEPVYVYENNVYLHTLTTNGYGITQAIYSFASYPKEMSYYMNSSGYNDQWLNVTYYSYSSQSATSTITEEPVLTVDFSDNRESENMRVTLKVLRYTGEQFGDEWFLDDLTVHTYVETYAGESLDSVIDVGVRSLDSNGEVEFILSYTEPYGYIVKHYFNTNEQNICIGNFTENSMMQFAYDSSTGNVSEGDYVSLPDTPTTSEFYPTGEDAINPTTLDGFAVIWSGNTGFLIAMGFIVAITVGFAKVAPESAIFGVIVLVGLTIGFLGYTGLLPFPIFVVVLLVIVLGITVVFTDLLTGKGKGNE